MCGGAQVFLDGFMHLGVEIPVLISCWSGKNGALVDCFQSGIVKTGSWDGSSQSCADCLAAVSRFDCGVTMPRTW